MAYTINYSDTNKGTISIEDSTINQQTSLDIPGRNTTSYGSVIAENFLKHCSAPGCFEKRRRAPDETEAITAWSSWRAIFAAQTPTL